MKRWWLWIVLLLSLGVNVGILLTLAVGGGEPGPDGGPDGSGIERSRGPEGRGSGPPPDRPGPNGPPDEIRFLDRLADRFGLQGADRERFLTLQRTFFRQAFEARRQGAALQRELGRELTVEEPDRQRIEQLIDGLARNRRDLDRSLADTILQTRGLLDGPQEAEYLGFIRHLRERMGRGREGPPRRRPRPPGRPTP